MGGKYYNKEQELKKAYNQTEKGKFIALQNAQRTQELSPEKVKAQSLARTHVPLKDSCEVCGSTEGLQRHHPDYSKPLEVITVCKFCHKKIHGGRLE